MTDKTLSVLLVDDHLMVREGLAFIINRDPGMKVVGECGDGLRVCQMAQQLDPDVVVLDIEMPGLNGLDVCRELTRKFKSLRVLMLTMHDDEHFVVRAIQAGAAGYLLKDAAAHKLTEGIRTVASGRPFFDQPEHRQVGELPAEDRYDSLTIRERQVLQMVAEGRTNRQIAHHLRLAVKTVDTHRTRLMRKLDIHNVNELVRYALKRGIVHLP
ncbi:MAG: response regulator transcription factor [Planctomycetes bacterium]|jgi:two-component system response regulator NreC|nr:response regulator transcription factor [Planctomycetota bacterium]